MTSPNDTPTHDQAGRDINSTSGRASYPESNAPVGSIAFGSPAPGVAGADRRQGAPDRQDATEGGPQPEEQQHACHSARCSHAAESLSRIRQRPRQPRKREHQPSCRLSDDEYTLVKTAAAACRMSIAGFLSHSALAAARNLQRTAAEIAGEREVLDELFAARRHLGYIGNNLNQVAKALNAGAFVPGADAALKAVHRAARRVEAAADSFLDQ